MKKKKRKDQWARRVWGRRQVRPDEQKKQKISAFPLPFRLSVRKVLGSWKSLSFTNFGINTEARGRAGFRQTLPETTVGTGCEGSRAVVCPHSMVSPVSGTDWASHHPGVNTHQITANLSGEPRLVLSMHPWHIANDHRKMHTCTGYTGTDSWFLEVHSTAEAPAWSIIMNWFPDEGKKTKNKKNTLKLSGGTQTHLHLQSWELEQKSSLQQSLLGM